MLIVAIGWIYVVLMMSVAEDTAVAGVMTFVFYGLVPVAVLLYLSGSGQRKRRRAAREAEQRLALTQSKEDAGRDAQPGG
jgi:biotin transporter BioY